MIIHNPILTGSFTVNGTDVASITSSAASIASLNSYTASLNAKSSSFATTGSNTFVGNQVVSGSLTVTGSITTPGTLTAQTLVVQTITSSVDFVTGSTRFGSKTSDTHQFTGSVSITGSLTSNGALSGTNATFNFFRSINETGFILRNDANSANLGGLTRRSYWAGGTAADTQIFAETGYAIYLNPGGSSSIGLTLTSTGAATFSSSVTASDGATIKQTDGSAQLKLERAGGSTGSMYIGADNIGFKVFDSSFNTRMTVTSSGNVGIGTTLPTDNIIGSGVFLDISSTTGGAVKLHYAPSSTYGELSLYKGSNGSYIDSTGAATLANNDLIFRTGGTSSNFGVTERMRIDSSGVTRLQKSGDSQHLVRTTSTTGARSATWNFQEDGTNIFQIGFWKGNSYDATHNAVLLRAIAADDIHLMTNDITRMFVSSSGQVGIGIITPYVKLHLQGSGGDVGQMLDGSGTPTLQLYSLTNEAGIGSNSYLSKPITFKINMTYGVSNSGTEAMRITSGGNVIINNSSSTCQHVFDVSTGNAPQQVMSGGAGSNTVGAASNFILKDNATSGTRQWLMQIDGSTQFATWYYNGSSWTKVGYQTTGGTWTNSDQRRKENIELITYGLNEVIQLQPKKFNFKIDENKKPYMGFIAQDVLSIIPEAVQSDIDGEEQYYAMNYDNLVPVLVNAIKELTARVQQLENK